MTQPENDNAPFFKSWTGWYIFVLVFLLILITIFYLITKRFA
ncbi:MAG TPA: hypothetical protein VFV31_14425 [Chitinophagaceae bacterium]|nr:hypothetical protein [Chitinophagaceae bacterium]